MTLILPKNYVNKLDSLTTQRAIQNLRLIFEKKLCAALNLTRVTAPLFVTAGEGINDDLNGVERAVSFDILHLKGKEAQIVQSLAKWKRIALKEYRFQTGEGLYTDMNAIRRDEEPDNLHSLYVDQWDWERIITREERTTEFLQSTVKKIVAAIAETSAQINAMFPALSVNISPDVTFASSQELEERYPDLTPREREDEFAKEHKTVFISQIGGALKNGLPHDGRAPDYDDWALNGDIVFWNDVLQRSFEVSSMGIRVDENSLAFQLKERGLYEARANLKYHKMLLNGELPLTIGGGIGQSRLCMLLLQKAHIGEVQASLWSEEMRVECQKHGIELLF